MSNRFAQRGPKDFSDIELQEGQTGAPVFADALCYIDCELVEIAAGGDHDLFIGKPVAGAVGQGAPLLFYGGQYGEMQNPEVRGDRK